MSHGAAVALLLGGVAARDLAISATEGQDTAALAAHAVVAWYVRPYGGSYGAADGTSYATAWNGLQAINWTTIQPGDTLYILGRHIGSTSAGRGWGNCNKAGVIIDGLHASYPAEQAEMVCSFRTIAYTSFVATAPGDPGYPSAYKKTGEAISGFYAGIEIDSVNGLSYLRAVPTAGDMVEGTNYFDDTNDTVYWWPTAGTFANKTWALADYETRNQISAANCVVRDMRFFSHNTGAGGKSAIQLLEGSTAAEIHDNEFRYCKVSIGCPSSFTGTGPASIHIHDNHCLYGMTFVQTDSRASAFIGWDIHDNLIEDMNVLGVIGTVDNQVFYMQSNQGWHVYDNIIDGFVNDAFACYATAMPGYVACIKDNIFERNIVRNGVSNGVDDLLNGFYFGGDGNDFTLDDPYQNNIVRNNLIYDCDATGIDPTNNAIAGIRIKTRSPEFSANRSFYVYNNVFANLTNMRGLQVNNGILDSTNTSQSPTDIHFVNNIVTGCRWGFFANSNLPQTEWLLDHNVWHDLLEALPFEMDGTTRTFADWRTALQGDGADGSVANLAEDNSLTSDPLFVDASTGNFRLYTGSPAIDAGMDAGATADFWLTARPVGGAHDIGAYEGAGVEVTSQTAIDLGGLPRGYNDADFTTADAYGPFSYDGQTAITLGGLPGAFNDADYTTADGPAPPNYFDGQTGIVLGGLPGALDDTVYTTGPQIEDFRISALGVLSGTVLPFGDQRILMYAEGVLSGHVTVFVDDDQLGKAIEQAGLRRVAMSPPRWLVRMPDSSRRVH